MITTDVQAWEEFRHHHLYFNKLWVAEQLGHYCGPGGTAPIVGSLRCIVRPIYNLYGMSIGAYSTNLSKDRPDEVPPGMFWCEYFTGKHYSINYTRYGYMWVAESCWEGIKDNGDGRFTMWNRSSHRIPLGGGAFWDNLQDVKHINVEFIGNNPIEIHLRHSPDPDYDQLVPVFTDSESVAISMLTDNFRSKWEWVDDYDDCGGHLKAPRMGFWVRNVAKTS